MATFSAAAALPGLLPTTASPPSRAPDSSPELRRGQRRLTLRARAKWGARLSQLLLPRQRRLTRARSRTYAFLPSTVRRLSLRSPRLTTEADNPRGTTSALRSHRSRG